MSLANLPPMELPPDWGADKPSGLKPQARGNNAAIPAGNQAQILDFNAPDQNAEMYTLAVYPTDFDPSSLYSQTGVIVQAQVSKYGVLNRVQIDYGDGGGGSQALNIDLKRGFKVALPASSMKVVVFNANDPTDPSPEELILNVGCSLGKGNSSDQDSLTITQRFDGAAKGFETTFAIPPHAKALSIYCSHTNNPATTGNDAVRVRFVGFFGGGSQVVYNFQTVDLQQSEFGPFEIPGNTAFVAISPNGAAAGPFTLLMVWHLGL